MNEDNFKIITEGPKKGKRVYFEDRVGVEFAFPMETYFLFKDALKNNYKIFYVDCSHKHNIKIPDIDYTFLTSPMESEEIYKKYKFSNEVLNLKNLQYLDITKLYNISINSDKIGFLITHPKLKLNFYCFDFVIFIKNDFDLNDLLKINFDLITINSIKEFDVNNLTVDLIFKLYDFYNFTFKDNIVLQDDLKKTNVNYDNTELISELIEWKKLMNLSGEYMENFKTPYTPYDNDIEKLNNIIYIKREYLNDVNLYKKLFMEKMCIQFWIFHKIILDDSVFFTNFLQITGGVKTTINNGKVEIDYNALYHCSWCDLLSDSDYRLFSCWQPPYQWLKK